MPPCGYIKREANFIGNFLESNYKRLREEVSEGKYPSLEIGMKAEVGNIDRHLSHSTNDIEKGVLLLSRFLYITCLSGATLGQTIKKIETIVTNVKVEERELIA